MPSKRQKELGLDTFKVEASEGHVELFQQFLEVRAHTQKKSLSDVFEELTEKLYVDAYGEEHAKRAFHVHLS